MLGVGKDVFTYHASVWCKHAEQRGFCVEQNSQGGADYVIWFIRKFHIMGYDVPTEKI